MYVYGHGFINDDLTCFYIIRENFLVKMFGACEYKDRIYFNKNNKLFSITKDFIENYFSKSVSLENITYPIIGNSLSVLNIPDESLRIEINRIDSGTHHIIVYNNKLYVQETFFNRIAIYNFIDETDQVDETTRFVPNIYPKGVSANIKLWPLSQKPLDDFNFEIEDVSELTVDNYRHINSLCIHPDFPDTLICSSSYLRNAIGNNQPSFIEKDSSIDFISMTDWTFTEYNVPQYGIHDITYNQNDNMLYYVNGWSLYKFDPYQKTYLGSVYTHPSAITNQVVSRGLKFDSSGNASYTVSEIVSRFNSITNKPDDSVCIIIYLSQQNTNEWSLISTKEINNLVVLSVVK